MSVKIHIGDCRDIMKGMKAGSVHCVITSPPYYGLRSYGVGTENGEIGLEETPQEYVETMVEVMRGVWRALRDDGLLFLNLASSYSSGIIESDEYVIRDDLTPEEREYVYAELAKHLKAKSEAMSEMWKTDAPTE